jgi:hypothetical protein
MEVDEREEVPERPKRKLRTDPWFPVAEPISPRLIRLAKMLKADIEDIELQQLNDDIPDFYNALKVQGEMTMTNDSSEKVLAEGWDDVDKSVGSGGAWMKWNDGQVHQINICGKPKHVEKDFGDGKGPKARIRIDVYVPGEGVKAWEMAPGTWKDLKEERSECKTPFADTIFAVKRLGTGTETRYKFRAQRVMTAAEIADRNSSSSAPQEDAPF